MRYLPKWNPVFCLLFLAMAGGCRHSVVTHAPAPSPTMAPSTRSDDGTVISGGGDGCVADFHRIARSIERRLGRTAAAPSSVALRRAVHQFRTSARTAKVTCVEYALFRRDQTRVHALNYPGTDRIEVNSTEWEKSSNGQKQLLVVHELLGLWEMDETTYQYTLRILATLMPSGVEISKFKVMGTAASALFARLQTSQQRCVSLSEDRMECSLNGAWAIRCTSRSQTVVQPATDESASCEFESSTLAAILFTGLNEIELVLPAGDPLWSQLSERPGETPIRLPGWDGSTTPVLHLD